MHWIGALGTGLYCGLIFLLSSQPLQVNEELKIPGLDKVVHMGIYGALALMVAWGLRHARRPHGPVVLFWAPIAFALLYGITDEWHQSLVPLREFDPWDLVADTAGALAAQAVVYCWWWGIPWRAALLGVPAVRE